MDCSLGGEGREGERVEGHARVCIWMSSVGVSVEGE